MEFINMKSVCMVTFLLLILSCKKNGDDTVLYNGRAETDILRLSAEVSGIIDSLAVEEGDPVHRRQVLVKINSERSEAQLRQQKAQLEELNINLKTLSAQIRQLDYQFSYTRDLLEKTKILVMEGAATRQRQDELATQVNVYQSQIDALKSNYDVIASKKEQLKAMMDLTWIIIGDSRIVSPIDGIVINKFMTQNELAIPGKVILELADLSQMEITIYIPLTDLHLIGFGQEGRIHVDGVDEALTGHVKWISSEAEFTPKTILTRETRTTLVYAVKLAVSNSQGLLKIGLPVDVEF